jgi:hypothetical protein
MHWDTANFMTISFPGKYLSPGIGVSLFYRRNTMSVLSLWPYQPELQLAEQIAKQFVCLRHRYNYGVKHLVCVPAA